MATTISSATGPLTLTTADNPLVITSTGAVTTTSSGANAIYGGTAAAWTITNSGVVSSSAGDGIVLEDGGSVTNNSTGTIKGDQYGIVFNAGPGSVTNSGSISSALGADSVAVDLGDGGSITNLAGGTITGGNVFINGAVGTITNSGIIATDSEDGVELAAGGSVTNNAGGSISNTDAAGVGVFIEVASGMVTNAGSISAIGGDGVLLLEGGSVSNGASGSITGQPAGIFIKNQTGTVTNAGQISGTGAQGTGVYLQNNGILTNASTGIVVGQKFGAFIEGGFGTLTNAGQISGATYDGVVLGMGGVVTNAAGASISGANAGVYVKYRAAGTVTNSGAITGTGTGSAGVELSDGGSVANNLTGSITGISFGVFITGASGTVSNAGAISGATYAIDFAGSGTNRLIVDPGAQFIGKVTANSTAANTIELVSGTGSIGGLGGVGSAFTNFQTLAVDAGASWTLTGANTTSSVLDAGSLDLAGTLNNSATITFQGTSQLLIDNAASFGSSVGAPSYTGPQLQHFVGGDKIDLKNIFSANVNLNYNATTGLLQITNGASQVATLDFQNSSLGSGTFQAMSDGGLGTLITLSGSSPPPPPPPPPPPIAGADVQWQNGLGGELAVWGMNGAQAVSSNIVSSGGSPAVPDATWSVAGLGDFNGDGTNDFLWRNQSGTLVDWTMNGSHITSSQVVTFGGSPVAPNNSWNVAGIGDFNGDGKSDILWRNTNGSLIDWTMNGSQVTASQQVTLGGNAATPDSSWNIAGIGDFSGDGKSDILWRNTNGSLIDWTMNGSQITSSQTVTLGGSAAMPDSSWSVAAIGDFSGDGKSDILWRNTNGSLIDWTMNGSQITSAQQVTFGGSPVSLDSSWQIAQIGDFNGNGTSDLLLRNTSSGAMEEWSMNGAQIASASQVTFQGSPATPPNTWNTLSKPTDFV
jgi:hypothetical protein